MRGWFHQLLVDPLSVKELSGIARRWQLYVGRCLYVGAIGFIVWMFWTNLTRRGRWMSPSAYAELGRELFYGYFAIQMVVAALGGITAAADMITKEIRAGTLGVLAITPLTPWRIIAGKWKVALLQTSTVLLCGAPIFGVCKYLGGVGFRELAYSLTLSVVSASLGAALALWFSTLFRAGYVVTLVAIVSLAVYSLLPMVLLFGNSDDVMTVLAWVHPLYGAVGAAIPPSMWARSSWANGWIGASLVTSLLIYGLLRAAEARVRVLIQRPGGEPPEAPSLDDLSRIPVPKHPRISALANLLRGRSGVWESGSILWKELSTRNVGMGKVSRLGVALLVFLLLSTMDTGGEWRVIVFWFSWIVLILTALANGVSLFVTEREQRKWDVLLSTPLSATEIVFAKLAAGLAGPAPLALMMSCFWLLSGLSRGVTLTGNFMNLVAVALVFLLAYAVGAAASLASRTQRTAFSASFGLLVGLLFVLPLVLLMLESFRVIPRRGDLAENIICCTNPAVFMIHVSEVLERSYYYEGWKIYVSGRERKILEFFPIYVAVYAALIALLVAWMVRRFDRIAGRS